MLRRAGDACGPPYWSVSMATYFHFIYLIVADRQRVEVSPLFLFFFRGFGGGGGGGGCDKKISRIRIVLVS